MFLTFVVCHGEVFAEFYPAAMVLCDLYRTVELGLGNISEKEVVGPRERKPVFCWVTEIIVGRCQLDGSLNEIFHA